MSGIHALLLNIVSRETGDVEAQTKFFRSEVDMPGYVESVERGYDNSPWRTERVWLLPTAALADPETDRSEEEQR